MEQRYPLLLHAGSLDQVVECWTAERHLALQAACRESLMASMSAAQIDNDLGGIGHEDAC